MDNLKAWIEPLLDDLGCRLYEIQWLTNEKPPILQISIEKKKGTVDLDTCVQCSDAISSMLDEKDWFDHEYNLEVCSPGAERELKSDEQIQAALGKYVYVKLKDPKQGFSQITGDLADMDEVSITIAYKEKTRNKKMVIDKDNIALIMTAVKL